MSAKASAVGKRLLVGRAFSSARLEHTLLSKVLALPVFASDALSSVAYATGEILIALTLVTSDPAQYVMPIAIAIALLLAIVVSSYRQTVRAYPGGGGAYIVSKDNLGQGAGLVAAAALLFDYMMTVVVSIVAGVVAIRSAFPSVEPYAVELSIVFVALVTLANLRGAKESGVLFAIPTYGFVVAIGMLVTVGLIGCVTGCAPMDADVEPLPDAATTAATVTVFALLKAFSSGATALTGVEAISNGVPAFRRPQAHNAATTLAVMGAIAITLFLGISWLATHTEGVIASDEISVPAQIGIAVFGDGSVGFLMVQFFTSAILILAANTAYQDFPRLASILARDRFLPSQFVNRGDRLVFSNGVIVLGFASAVMIWIFDASLTAVIHLYVVGVFTSFTLSQAGMIKHWHQEGQRGENAQKGWRRSIVINAVGCVVTATVLVVVIASKFLDGAWLSILIMGVMVPAFYGIHHHYAWVGRQLRRGTVTAGASVGNHVVILVRQPDAAVAEALGYVRSLRPTSVRAVTPGSTATSELTGWWTSFAGEGPTRLERLGEGNLTAAMKAFVRSIETGPEDFVTVVVPEMVRGNLLRYLVGRRDLVRLKASLLQEPRVVVTDVPVVVAEGGEPRGVDAKPLIPGRTVTLVFVAGLNDAAMRAVNYARSLEAPITRAIYFEVDPDEAERLEGRWLESRLDVPLDIVEAPFRDLTTPMLEEVRRYSDREDTVVNVVIPEVVVSHWWHLPLHNQNALFIKRLFLFEDRVVLTDVPFRLGERTVSDPAASART